MVTKSSTQQRAITAALSTLAENWQEQTFPVNVIQIARRMDLVVSVASLREDISGALLRNAESNKWEILYAKSDSPNRQRFTVAHELGHYMDRDAGGLPKEEVDFRNELSSQGTNQREIFANTYAAELLMPGWAVEDYRRNGFGVQSMAKMFAVSPSAMEIRLRNL